MLVTAMLLTLVGVATATDVLRHRIYNWTTYPGILAAIGLSAVGPLLRRGGVDEAWLRHWLGWQSMGECLAGLALCGSLMLVCFVLFRVGGGDVKLMAMLGALLGPQKGLEALLWTFVLGGCMGLCLLIWRVGAVWLVVRVVRQIGWTLRLGRWRPLSPEERAMLQPPLFLAPSAAVAVVIVQFELIH